MGLNTRLSSSAQRWLPLFLSVYLLLQPLLDILTSLGANAGYSITAGVVVRTLFMAFAFLYLVFVSRFEGRWRCLLYAGLLVAYLALFMLRLLLLGGLSLCFDNLKEVVKTFFTPFVLLFFYAVYKEHGCLVPTRTVAVTGALYTGVILVAALTGTSNPSYPNSGHGLNGWFYAANETGCIVAIVAPLTVYYCVQQATTITRKRWWKALLIAVALISVGFAANGIGTKVVFAFTALYGAAACVWAAVRWFQTRQRSLLVQFGVLAVFCVFTFSMLASSSLLSYITDVYIPVGDEDSEQAALAIEQASEGYVIPEGVDPATVPSVPSEGTWLRNLIENNTFVGMLDRVLSRRLLTTSPSLQIYLDGPLFTKLVGIGYTNAPTYNRDVLHMIEMDPIAIAIRHGILGLVLYVVPYLAAIGYLVVQFFRRLKQRLADLEYCSYLYSTLAGFAIACLAGHALVSPGVSIFVIVSGINLWAITQRQNQA